MEGFWVVHSPWVSVENLHNADPTASFVSPKTSGNRAVFRKRKPIYINAPLKPPHSGWENLLGYLKQNKIESSIGLVVDKRNFPDPDIEELVLEMKTGSRHTMAYYLDSNRHC